MVLPCIAMTKYELPPEVSGAGVKVESDWDNSGNFQHADGSTFRNNKSIVGPF